jgi:hypothetical protein
MKFKSLLDGEEKDYFCIMHLSYGINYKRKILWDYAKENKVIGLDLPDVVNGNWNKETIKETARNEGISPLWENQFDLFYSMEKGDIVMILQGWKSVLGVGKVVGEPPEFSKSKKGEFFEHTRKVDWIKTYGLDEVPCRAEGFNRTLLRIEQTSKWWSNLTNIEIP